VYFVPGEVHFRYLEMPRPVELQWIEVTDQLLTVTHVPCDHYLPPLESSPRHGTAYLIRKGAGKPIVHNFTASIRIDGMIHAQIGIVFRRVESFVSYDSHSFYSTLAALAGADSVVVPDDGVDIETWQPDERLRAGIAYGFDDINRARLSRSSTSAIIYELVEQSKHSVECFVGFWRNRLGL
jgi:hypothetical protein